MEDRLIYQDMPGFLPAEERLDANEHPYFRSHSKKVMSISHHLAHAYSAFACSPFDDGVIMIVDGVGSYRSDVVEPFPESDTATPLARESESYYKFSGKTIECLKKVWMEPDRGFLSDEFYNMPGLGALYSRASTYIFGDWNKCGELMGLAPYGRHDQIKPLMDIANNDLTVPRWSAEFNQPYVADTGEKWETSPSMRHWEDLGVAGSGRYRKGVAGPRQLAAGNHGRQKPLYRRRRGIELRRQRTRGAGIQIRERLDSARRG